MTQIFIHCFSEIFYLKKFIEQFWNRREWIKNHFWIVRAVYISCQLKTVKLLCNLFVKLLDSARVFVHLKNCNFVEKSFFTYNNISVELNWNFLEMIAVGRLLALVSAKFPKIGTINTSMTRWFFCGCRRRLWSWSLI